MSTDTVEPKEDLEQESDPDLTRAEQVLRELAAAFNADDASPFSLEQLKAVRHTFALRPLSSASLPQIDARYRTLVEQLPAVVFMAFLDKGIGEAYVSPQIEELLGFSQEEWLNDPVRWYQQIHPDDKLRWSMEAADLFLSGTPLKSLYRVMARDGRVVWFQCEAKMVRNEDGRPWFIHGVAFDISELKRAEENLRKSESMLEGLFEHAPDTVVVVNDEGRILRVNSQVERMFGHKSDELLGQPVETLIPEKFRFPYKQRRQDDVSESYTRPMGAGIELLAKRKDGSEFPVDIMVSPMEAETGNMMIAVVRDITRRKQDEKALREYAERLRVLSRRLMEVQELERRNIARELHDEIGQLLTGLKLTLEMGKRVPETAAGKSLEQARILVNDLMGRARKLSLDLRPAMLDDLGLLPALLWHLEHYTAQTNVRVHFSHSGLENRRFLPEVETAAYRIVQEALTNVARHAQVDEASVRLWTGNNKLFIDIADRGVGFETYQVSETSGLAGMKERATLLGGQVTVESSPGVGTRLTAQLSTGGQNGGDLFALR